MQASKWELTVNDPNCDEPVVSTHNDFDEMLSHIRRTYDPTGRYEDEGRAGCNAPTPIKLSSVTMARSKRLTYAPSSERSTRF